MNRFLLWLVCGGVMSMLAAYANASDCHQRYAPVQAAYVAPVVAYAQPVVAPLQQYAYTEPAQAIVLPGKVTYTAPVVTYELQQVVGYDYAAPIVAPYVLQQNVQHGYGAQLQQQNFHHHAQQFRHHAQQLRQQQRHGNGGLLGQMQDNIQARIEDRQEFRQQALRRQNFVMQLRAK
jgi:hypothetical protein